MSCTPDPRAAAHPPPPLVVVRRPAKPAKSVTRDDLLDLVRAAAAIHGDRLTQVQFQSHTGLPRAGWDRHFRTWRDCKQAAGLSGQRAVNAPRQYTDDEVLADLHRIAGIVGRLPNCTDIRRHGRYGNVPFNRWKRIKAIHHAYADWLKQRDTAAFSVADAPAPAPPVEPATTTARPTDASTRDTAPQVGNGSSATPRTRPARQRRSARSGSPGPPKTATKRARKRLAVAAVEDQLALPPALPPTPGRVYGEALAHPEFRHAPTCESGVIALFGVMARELGYSIEAVHAAFPDAEVKRRVDVKRDTWERLRVEFEFCSRNFRIHGHDPALCDLIICWHHNWPACPVRVLELKRVLEQQQVPRRKASTRRKAVKKTTKRPSR